MAQDRSGNFMLPHCERVAKPGPTLPPADQILWMGICRGTVTTLVEVSRAFQGSLPICAPQGSTPTQWEAVVVKYLRDHPEELHYSFTSSAFAALAKAWPCDQKGR
jgi:hypothetical protein